MTTRYIRRNKNLTSLQILPEIGSINKTADNGESHFTYTNNADDKKQYHGTKQPVEKIEIFGATKSVRFDKVIYIR